VCRCPRKWCGILLRIALRRQAAQQDDAAALIELVEHLGELDAEGSERKVLLGDVGNAQPALLHRCQRRFQFLDVVRREPMKPARVLPQVIGFPGGRLVVRLGAVLHRIVPPGFKLSRRLVFGA